jgi:hypothetical protein
VLVHLNNSVERERDGKEEEEEENRSAALYDIPREIHHHHPKEIK